MSTATNSRNPRPSEPFRSPTKDVIYKVEQVKGVMHENIERAAENCVKLESIDRTAEDLMKEAGVFQINAKKLKDKLWWKNMRIWLIIACIILIILGILIAVIYSYKDKQ